MPKTTAQKLAQARFEGKTYEPINIRVLIGERDQINAAARARGLKCQPERAVTSCHLLS